LDYQCNEPASPIIAPGFRVWLPYPGFQTPVSGFNLTLDLIKGGLAVDRSAKEKSNYRSVQHQPKGVTLSIQSSFMR
jgi:hypothetical protein